MTDGQTNTHHKLSRVPISIRTSDVTYGTNNDRAIESREKYKENKQFNCSQLSRTR